MRTCSTTSQQRHQTPLPPRLHRVQRHADYTDVQNGDRQCCVPHGDDSVEVKWVDHSGRDDCEYETGCCSKTVDSRGRGRHWSARRVVLRGHADGEASTILHNPYNLTSRLLPRHTQHAEARCARFRRFHMDATHDNDELKLESCLWLDCHNIRVQLSSYRYVIHYRVMQVPAKFSEYTF